MKTEFGRQFLKDIDRLPSQALQASDIIEAVEAAKSLSEIVGIKKLKKLSNSLPGAGW